nr:Chain C, P [Homo sapiens]
VRSRRCLRL